MIKYEFLAMCESCCNLDVVSNQTVVTNVFGVDKKCDSVITCKNIELCRKAYKFGLELRK